MCQLSEIARFQCAIQRRKYEYLPIEFDDDRMLYFRWVTTRFLLRAAFRRVGVQQVAQIVVRFVIGGFIVSLFAALGDALKPKSFAGLFGAARR